MQVGTISRTEQREKRIFCGRGGGGGRGREEPHGSRPEARVAVEGREGSAPTNGQGLAHCKARAQRKPAQDTVLSVRMGGAQFAVCVPISPHVEGERDGTVGLCRLHKRR